MGSSKSKPRKGHKNPKHLPKVGSPANQQWEHEMHRKVVFGSSVGMYIIGAILVLTLLGLLLLTL